MSSRKHSDSIVVVSGLPRSGTSMIMSMLDAGGLKSVTDNVRKADCDNPKGYYEYQKVKSLKRDSSWLVHYKGQAIKIISHLLFYLPGNLSYRIVFAQRNMQEILASQSKMYLRLNKNDHADNNVLSRQFSRHLQEIHAWMQQQKNVDFLDVHYQMVLSHPLHYAKKIQNFVQVALDCKSMAAVVDMSLYRNRNRI